MDDIRIEKHKYGYIIMYKNFHTCRLGNPTVWLLDNEISQIYTTEEFAKNDIRSFKMFITKNYNGDFSKWEEKELKRLNRKEQYYACNILYKDNTGAFAAVSKKKLAQIIEDQIDKIKEIKIN